MNGSAASRPADAAWVAALCEGAWTRCAPLRERLSGAGFGPGRWPNWEQLARVPILDKRSLHPQQEAVPPLGALAPEGLAPEVLFFSPGGICEPYLPSAERRLATAMSALGFGPGDVVLNGFNYHFTPAGLLFHGALRRAGCTVLAAGPHNTDTSVVFARHAAANGFVGISSHLKQITDRARQGGLGVGPGRELPLARALAGGEPYGSPIRQELAGLGVQCHDVYGSGDLGIVAVECGTPFVLRLLEGVLAEVVDPASGVRLAAGEVGHLLLTVNNPEYPLVRFGTGDLARLPGDGRLEIVGRLDASARVRGMLLYPAQVQAAVAAHPAIATAFVLVDRKDDRDVLEAVLLVRDEGARAEAEKAFAARFHETGRLSIDRFVAPGTAPADGPAVRDLRRSTRAR